MLNFICIYNYTKAQNIIILIKIQTTVSFSSIYKAHDVQNVHERVFMIDILQNFQMSRGTDDRPSSDTFRLG